MEDSGFDKFIQHDGKEYYVTGTYTSRYVDDSFSHEFGVEHRGHHEVEDFEIETISLDTPDGSVDLDWPVISQDLRDAVTEEIMGMEVC